MTAHSTLGASGAYRWTVCTAQPSMVAGVSSPSGYHAALGTVAHEVGERCLLENKQAQDFMGTVFTEHVGDELKEFTVDQNMIDAVQLYVDHVRTVSTGAPLHIEQRVDLSRLYRGMFGTVDCWFVRDSVLYVRDYKHGEFKPVEVRDNVQLAYYAIGAFFKALDAGHQITAVDVGIVQPRFAHVDGPVRTWQLTVTELNEWANFLATKARETVESPRMVAGPHCHWCVAKNCRARAYELIKLTTLEHPIGELQDDECERFLENMAMLKDGFERLESAILERMKVGRITSKKYKLIHTSPRASCPDPQAMYDMLPLLGLNVEDFQKSGPPTPISRTQAKKKAGDKYPLIEPHYKVGEKGVKLAPITARGQAITPKTNDDVMTAFAGFTPTPEKKEP